MICTLLSFLALTAKYGWYISIKLWLINNKIRFLQSYSDILLSIYFNEYISKNEEVYFNTAI